MYSQNHDQIGNTAEGLRPANLLGIDACKVAAVVLACAPFVPMLFMGEEFFARTPFPYFVSHSDPELNDAVLRSLSGAVRRGFDTVAKLEYANANRSLAGRVQVHQAYKKALDELIASLGDLA